MKPFLAPSQNSPLQNRAITAWGAVWVPTFTLLLGSLTGCYHATGIQRPPLIAEEIPSVLGDRVGGFKATASAGDYLLGSDSIQLAVDGTPFGSKSAAPGAARGGSILDIGNVTLDQNYLPSSTPADRLERLTPVVNQDPDLPLAFTSFQVSNEQNLSTIIMQGGLYDPNHNKVTGAKKWDPSGLVSGVSVTHSIALANLQSYVTLTTTLTNNSGEKLGIYNLGDYLFQQGGGFRFNIPASKDYSGNVLNNWGVDIPATGAGTVFGAPYQGVEASMVGLMGNEPGGDLDYHCSLGFLPVSDDQLLVTSDPQPVFTDPRPKATPRLVVGGLPMQGGVGLDPGGNITYTRRIYVLGGTSTGFATGYYGQTLGQANQATGLFNLMAMERYTLRAMEFGTTLFYVDGSAQLAGPLQSEVRIERYKGTVSPFNPDGSENFANYLADGARTDDPTLWVLERTEWFEPEDGYNGTTSAPGYIGALLPVGDATNPVAYYRVAFRNRISKTTPTAPLMTAAAPPWIYYTPTNTTGVNQPLPMGIKSGSVFQAIPASNLCPEFTGTNNDGIVNGGLSIGDKWIGGIMVGRKFVEVSISARASSDSGGSGAWQPLRVTVVGETVGGKVTPDPSFPRARTLGGVFNPTTHMKDFTGSNLGVNGFLGGNQAFATSLGTGIWLPGGSYTLYGTRGPLSALVVQDANVDTALSVPGHTFVVFQDRLPVGWTSFDLPGPSQITTGGYLPIEKLSSALAEGIQVVANTEMDRLTSPSIMQSDFRSEFEYYGSYDAQRVAVQFDPFVIGARSSVLNGFGPVTALFTPEPRNERKGGARDSSAWTLADFQFQAEGQFTVVQRPCGPQGLFTLKNFTPATAAVVSDPNSWWNALGYLSQGHTNGQFDAIELLCGERWGDPAHPEYVDSDPADPKTPDAWFTEFKQLRADWFAIISQQPPTHFTKALGFSSAMYSVDTPVGLARTYVKAQGWSTTLTSGFYQTAMTPFQTALTNGAAVASTGPLLDVILTGTDGKAISIGGLVEGTNPQVTLTVNLWVTDWIPVEELRVVVNGTVTSLDLSQLTAATDDWRHMTGTFTIPMPTGKDAWVVVEAGVPLSTTGAYAAGTPWSRVMKGIYPIAVTNPIFVDVNGGGYTPPGL